jgi:hypothetical protein
MDDTRTQRIPSPHEPVLGSRRRKEADPFDAQHVPPPHVGGYGSGVQSANFGWENSHPIPLPFRGGEGESLAALVVLSSIRRMLQ